MKMQNGDEEKKSDVQCFLPLIVLLIAMIVFGAASSKGMYQYGCKTNANAFMYFLYNMINNLLLGIPGVISAVHFKDTTFEVKQFH